MIPADSSLQSVEGNLCLQLKIANLFISSHFSFFSQNLFYLIFQIYFIPFFNLFLLAQNFKFIYLIPFFIFFSKFIFISFSKFILFHFSIYFYFYQSTFIFSFVSSFVFSFILSFLSLFVFHLFITYNYTKTIPIKIS